MRISARHTWALALLGIVVMALTGDDTDPEAERTARPPAKNVRGEKNPPLEELLKSTTLTSATVLRPDTAESALAKYLEAWRDQDWEEMVRHTQRSWRSTQKDPVRLLSGWYDYRTLLAIHIGTPRRRSAVAADVPVTVRYSIGKRVSKKKIVARVIRESAPYQPSTQGDWGVNPYTMLRERDVE